MKIVHCCALIAALAVPALAQGAPLEPPADFDAAAWQTEWDAHDTDSDGRLSREEAIAGNPSVAEIFDEIDANGDGYISPEEDKAMLWRAQQKDARSDE